MLKISDELKNAPKTSTDETASRVLQYMTHNKGRYYLGKGDNKKCLGSSVKVVILAIDPPQNFINHRTYFIKEGDVNVVICASPDGKKPYPYIEEKQAEACKECKWSVTGSGNRDGHQGKSQACNSSKTLYFLFADDLYSDIFALNTPITSLKGLTNYRCDLSEVGAPIAGVWTLMGFCPDAGYSLPIYSPILNEKGELQGPKGKDLIHTTTLAASASFGEIPQLTGKPEATKALESLAEPEEMPIQGEMPSQRQKPSEVMIDDPIDIDDIFGEKKEVPEKTTLNVIVDYIGELTEIAAIKYYIQNDAKELIAELTYMDKESLKAFVKEKIEIIKQSSMKPNYGNECSTTEPPSVLQTAIELINSMCAKHELPKLLTKIKEIDIPETDTLAVRNIFISHAQNVVGEIWNPDKLHAKSKDGYPCFKSNGGYRLRRDTSNSNTDTIRKELTEEDTELETLINSLE